MKRPLAWSLLYGAAFSAATARADPEQVATARQLAIQGIDAVEGGNCAGGAPLLERAESLHHASVHLQYLARCRVKDGKLVAATELWRRIIRDGAPADASPAVKTALAEANTELSRTLPRLATTTVRSARAYDKLTLTLDGAPLPGDIVDAPQVVDPGDHDLVANAPGFATWTKHWSVAEGGAVTFTIELEPGASDAVAASPGAGANDKSGGPSWVTPAGWITASVGAATLIAGTVTWLARNNRRSDLEHNCPNELCTGGAYKSEADVDSAKSSVQTLTAATNVLMISGAVVLAGGVTLLVVGGHDKTEPHTAVLAGAPLANAGLTLLQEW
jgi:hypothetical protein